MKNVFKEFNDTYSLYLMQNNELSQALKSTPSNVAKFDGDFSEFMNSAPAKYNREVIAPIQGLIQKTVHEIDNLIPSVFPSDRNDIETWIKSELRSVCGLKPEKAYDDSFSSSYKESFTKFDFIIDWLEKNQVYDIDFIYELSLVLNYLELEHRASELWGIAPLFNYMPKKDDAVILIQKGLFIYENNQLEDKTIVLNIVGILNNLDFYLQQRILDWIKTNIKDEFIISLYSSGSGM